MRYDVAIVSGGPAGSTCAAVCADGGLRTLVLERSVFPREKVCGDCANPACWPILDRLHLRERVPALPHSWIEEVEFIGVNGRSVRQEISGEIAIKRSVLDLLLLTRARELGAEIREGVTVTALEKGWRIQTSGETFHAHTLVAADGRNSTVARLLGLLPPSARERVSVQTHFAAPDDFGERVVMRLLPNGYCGLGSVGTVESTESFHEELAWQDDGGFRRGCVCLNVRRHSSQVRSIDSRGAIPAFSPAWKMMEPRDLAVFLPERHSQNQLS